MVFNYVKLRKLIGTIIKNFGGGTHNAILRRSSGDRNCTIVVPGDKNKQSEMFAFALKNILISAEGLEVGPDNEEDSLVFRGVEYKFDEAPVPISPDGLTVVAWEATVSTL